MCSALSPHTSPAHQQQTLDVLPCKWCASGQVQLEVGQIEAAARTGGVGAH